MATRNSANQASHPVSKNGSLRNKRILLVEDNFLVGISLKTILEEFGCEVLGPVASVEKGKDLALREEFNAAVLDINIVGGTSIPIAQELQQQQCPFIFVTGYLNLNMLPDDFSQVRRLDKPIDEKELKHALAAEIAPGN